jgi:hypothetical protein
MTTPTPSPPSTPPSLFTPPYIPTPTHLAAGQDVSQLLYQVPRIPGRVSTSLAAGQLGKELRVQGSHGSQVC